MILFFFNVNFVKDSFNIKFHLFEGVIFYVYSLFILSLLFFNINYIINIFSIVQMIIDKFFNISDPLQLYIYF